MPFTCSGNARAARGVGETVGELRAELAELLVETLRQTLQAPQARRHRQRVARERAGLIDRTGRRDEPHQIFAAAVGADRQPAADDLAEARQIGNDAAPALRAAGTDAESGDHFVEDQQDAVARADLAQALQKPRLRQHHAHVAGDRLDDERGDLIGERFAEPLDRRHVVIGGEQRVGCRGARDARAGRHAERRQARPGLHEKLIAVPVIAALELDDLLAPRVRARHAHGAHRRFGAGADEAHHLERRHHLPHELAELHFELGRRAEARALFAPRR